MAIGLCVLIVLLTIIGIVHGSPLSTSGTVGFANNGSDALLSYPGGNTSLNLTANTSVILNFSLNVPVTNYSVSIPSNVSANLSGAYDILQVFCSAPTSTPVCTINKALNGGDVYSQQDGLCDVHLSCVPSTILLANGTACPTNVNATVAAVNQTNLTIHKNLTITKTGTLFSISLENFSTSIDGSFMNATQSIDIPYVCPLDLQNLTGQASASELFNLCTGYAPLFTDWLNLTMNRCFDNFDAYRDYVNKNNDVLSKQNQDLSECKSAGGSKDGTIQSLNAQVSDLNTIITGDQDRESYYLIIGGFMFVIILGLGVGVAVLWHRAHKE